MEGASHVEVRAEELDAPAAIAARRAAGAREYQAKVTAALTLYESMGAQANIAEVVRQKCVEALPKAIDNLVSMALGKKRGTPGAVQVQAIKLVAGGAGRSLEAVPGASGATPLAELPLGELESVLRSMADNVQSMRAIESTAQLVESTDVTLPKSGSTDTPP